MKQIRQLLKNISKAFVRIPLGLYLAVVTIVATILRLVGITRSDIWHDEGYSAMIITFPPVEIIGHAVRDFHPPLYVLTLHVWSLLFGTSELALRSLSMVCGVATVVLLYFIVKKLRFSESAARLAALFAAFAPFLIRYSEEARMYGMAALFVCAATLALLNALDVAAKSKKKQLLWWVAYGVLMAAALYTHYYTAFIVFVHIGYAWYRSGGLLPLIKNRFWWIGNLIAAGLFGAWLPIAAAQFNRVQQGYWIPPVDAETIPNTFMQFVAFASNSLNPGIEFIIFIAFVCFVTVFMLRTPKPTRPEVWFVLGWICVPLLIAFGVSIIKQPVYYDRYFIYSAAAFSVLLAIIVTSPQLKLWAKSAIIVIILATSSSFIVWQLSNTTYHQMSTVAAHVNESVEKDDFLISGELYTFFDFSYYNHTGKELHLLSAGDLIPTGESSLIYAKRDSIVVHNLEDINKTDSKRVWLIGKTGEHDYDTTLVPHNWRLVSHTQAGDSSVRLYDISAE